MDTRYQGVERTSIAYALLSKWGWQEGEGLGARKQGMTSHIKVKRKVDASGIGTEAQRLEGEWTSGMAAYDKVLSSLQVTCKPAALEGNSLAASGKPPQTKRSILNVQHQKPIKSKKKEKSTRIPKRRQQPADSQEDGCGEGAGEPNRVPPQEERILPVISKSGKQGKKKKLGPQAGYFRKAARGKDVNVYSACDLTAILGGLQTLQEPQNAPHRLQSLDCIAQTSAATCSMPEAETPVTEGQVQNDAPKKEWWHGRFVQVSRFGNSSPSKFKCNKEDVKLNNFSETDQANLWTAVMDKQSKGKQGLGLSSTLKVGGTRWKGTAITFHDSDDDADS